MCVSNGLNVFLRNGHFKLMKLNLKCPSFICSSKINNELHNATGIDSKFLINWLIDYLQDRKHATRYGGSVSTEAAITASIAQGSGVRPSEYNIYASDLHPLNASNIFVKFADDTYLISGAATRHIIADEIDGVHRGRLKQLKVELQQIKINANSARWSLEVAPSTAT